MYEPMSGQDVAVRTWNLLNDIHSDMVKLNEASVWNQVSSDVLLRYVADISDVADSLLSIAQSDTWHPGGKAAAARLLGGIEKVVSEFHMDMNSEVSRTVAIGFFGEFLNYVRDDIHGNNW